MFQVTSNSIVFPFSRYPTIIHNTINQIITYVQKKKTITTHYVLLYFQDEIEAGQGAGNQGRGKDISTIVNAEKEEGKEQVPEVQQTEELPPVVPVQQDVVKAKSDEDESEEELRVVPKQRGRGYRKRHRKLNALDVDSADTDQSDEDFKGDR